jgi:hypothetical protein
MRKMSQSSKSAFPITRWTEAKIAGLKQYFTGNPCKHGHISPRDVSDRSCYQCKLIKAAKWKHENPDKHAAANNKWSKLNRESVQATVRRRKAKDPKAHWVHIVYSGAKARSKKRNVEFNLTKEYILSITGSHCPVFGTEFDFVGTGKIRPESPSLDRIDAKIGYIVGNVAVISMKANTIKSAYTSNDIRKVADWLQAEGF